VFGMRTGVPPPTKHQHEELERGSSEKSENNECLAYATPTTPCVSPDRGISTPRLNALLRFHLVPINVVISHGPQRFLILGLVSRLDAFSGYPFPT